VPDGEGGQVLSPWKTDIQDLTLPEKARRPTLVITSLMTGIVLHGHALGRRYLLIQLVTQLADEPDTLDTRTFMARRPPLIRAPTA